MTTERIRNKALLRKRVTAEQASELVKDGMTIGTCGSISTGYPRAFFASLVQRAKKGEKFQIDIWTAAPLGPEVDGALAEAGLIRRRLCCQSNSIMTNCINEGKILYADMGACAFPTGVRYGQFGKLDLAVIEAVAITESGHIIPSLSVADGPTMINAAEQVIIELNNAIPSDIWGIHDIYVPEPPPFRKAIPLTAVNERIGTPFIEVNPDKISAIIESSFPGTPSPKPKIDEISQAIANNVIRFLKSEVKAGRLPENLLPFQSGLGSLGAAVLNEIARSDLQGLSIHSALLSDGVLDLIDLGKVSFASGSGLFLSYDGLNKFFNRLSVYKEKLVLRPVDVVNSPEVIQRLGVLALNSAVEVDIYGHVNSSHITASRLLSGVGGSIEFARNAYLSIFMTPSVTRGTTISAIVPMVSHVDHTEHEVHVIITEQGIADLRGRDPKERAQIIIENCAHPDFRPLLRQYFEKARRNGGHEPHILEESLAFHIRLLRTGDMKPI